MAESTPGRAARENPLITETLNFLRMISLTRSELEPDPSLRNQLEQYVVGLLGSESKPVKWEAVRLISEYRFATGFSPIWKILQLEPDPVTQFHLAQALAHLPSGWSEIEEGGFLAWMLGT